jgi:hypothetical protein
MCANDKSSSKNESHHHHHHHGVTGIHGLIRRFSITFGPQNMSVPGDYMIQNYSKILKLKLSKF